MNKYISIKRKHEKMVNEFPMGFAFSDKQFREAKEKLGVNSNDELLSISGSGFIRKTDKDAFSELMRTINKETEDMIKDDEYLYQGFLYELGNHEYCYCSDPVPTLEAVGLTLNEANKDSRIKGIFKNALTEYWATCEC